MQRAGRTLHRRSARRRAGVSAGRARDPRYRGGPAQAPAQRHRDIAAVLAPVRRRTGSCVQTAQGHAPRGAGDQCGGDLAHRAQHRLRDRCGSCAHQPLQRAAEGGTVAGGEYRAGRRQPARRTLRPGDERRVHPLVRRGRFPATTGVHRCGDLPRLPRHRDPAHERFGARRSRSVSVHRTTRFARDRRRLSVAGRVGCDGRGYAPAHAARARTGQAAARPQDRAPAAGGSAIPVPARDPRHRQRAGLARSARSPGRTARGSRCGPCPFQRRALRLSRVPEIMDMVPGRTETQEEQQAVDERMPREIPVAAASARMARVAPATACAGERDGYALQRAARHLRTDPQSAADRPDRQHRHARGERAALSRPARDQVLHRIEFSAGEERREVGSGGGDRGDDEIICTLRGAHRTRVAGGSRRASAQAQLLRSALGEEGGAGGGVGAQHAVWSAHQSEEARALRADEPGRIARGVHSRGAGEWRVQHPGAVLRPQPETDRRHRGAGTQGAPPGCAGGRRTDLRLLRCAYPGRHP